MKYTEIPRKPQPLYPTGLPEAERTVLPLSPLPRLNLH